jgi:hypothetical protein
MFVLTIFVGVIGLFTFQEWINKTSSAYLDDKLKLIIFIVSSAIGPSIFYFLFKKIDNDWWQYKWTNFLIQIPNLNGWYFGKVESIVRSEENKSVIKDCSIEIVQNGSSIKVNMYLFEENENHFSICENINAVLVCESSQTKLYYIYRNEKDQRKVLTGPPSSIGTAELRVAKEATGEMKLYGSYYNQRGNTGIIIAKYIDQTIANEFRKPIQQPN